MAKAFRFYWHPIGKQIPCGAKSTLTTIGQARELARKTGVGIYLYDEGLFRLLRSQKRIEDPCDLVDAEPTVIVDGDGHVTRFYSQARVRSRRR